MDVKVNPTRQDPYNHFKFLVKWSGRTVAGVSSIYVLNKSKEVKYHDKRDGENTPRISLRKAKYGAIILKRGLTYDLEFEKWVNEAPNNSPKDIIIEEIEELTKNVVAYRFFGCWVSEYQAISTFGSNSIAVVIEHINIENDGWIRINVAMEENK